MGCVATATGRPGRAACAAGLAKKALSIRPRPAKGLDARTAAGVQSNVRGRTKAGRGTRLDWPATLRQGRPRSRADLHWQARGGEPPLLWLIVLDTSASTRRQRALADAKALLGEYFEQAYRARARVALVTAGGAQPAWQRAGVKASRALQGWLDATGAGGGTPLVEALAQSARWLEHRQRRHPDEQQRVLVLTDGRLKAIDSLPHFTADGLLVDLERGSLRLGRARPMAERLGLEYWHIDN